VWTGEFREPRAGDWYLSGAWVEAYQAKHDLSTKYHIARLFVVEYAITARIVRYWAPGEGKQ
jgi:hypothetical protein